jgi:PAS domain S-box-containing protein
LFSEDGLPAHGYCLLWQPDLIALHTVSDAVIGAAYFSIPLALVYFVVRRSDLAFGWIFWMFAAFILACGTTHFMDIWVLWHADYGIQGLIKVATAIISATTAVALWPLVVRALSVPSPAQVQRVSEQLASEVQERRRAERSLLQSEQNLRALFEGLTSHAIYMLDTGGVVTTWNAGATRIKGYSQQEIIGRHFSIFYTPEDRDAGQLTQALEMAEREGRFESEGWRVRKDGSRFWTRSTIQPLRDSAHRLLGYAKITQDITERREAELALQQTRATLLQAQKMETVGQLTGGIAHDFNNLLTTILGGADLLMQRGEVISEGGRRLLRAIGEAAERGSHLTQRLLAFSRKQALAPTVVDINSLIAGMSDLLHRTLGESVGVETVLSAGLWPCFVDRNQLENALLNLAINARDAMPRGGRLTLETGNVFLDDSYAAEHTDVPSGQYVMVAVSDTGSGMSAGVMQRAFEPFFTTKAAGSGTGLGLSQVYGFVKQSGGHIKLYSELGQGATVKIYLPRDKSAAEPAAKEFPASSDTPSGTETVLVVEDHDGVRHYVIDALHHLGYHVLVAEQPERALDLLDAHPETALLFTDIGLPGMNGRQLADEAQRRQHGLRVLYTTGYARNAVVHNGLIDQGVHLLPKPYTVAALARKLREVLRGG